MWMQRATLRKRDCNRPGQASILRALRWNRLVTGNSSRCWRMARRCERMGGAVWFQPARDRRLGDANCAVAALGRVRPFCGSPAPKGTVRTVRVASSLTRSPDTNLLFFRVAVRICCRSSFGGALLRRPATGSRPVISLYQAGWKVQAHASLTAPRVIAWNVPGWPNVLS